MKLTPSADPSKGLANLGAEVYAFAGLSFTWEPDGTPGDPDLHIEGNAEFADGRYRVTRMEITGAITSEQLHKIPVQGLLRDTVRLMILSGYDIDPNIAKDGPTDQAIQAVAAIYKVAHAIGDPPTKAVEKALGLAESTAARWVARAREKKYLGPPEHGRATV